LWLNSHSTISAKFYGAGIVARPYLASLITLLVSNSALGQNLIVNSDFNLGTDGWVGGILDSARGSPKAPSLFVKGANTYASSDCIAVDNTKVYTFQGEVIVDSGQGGMATMNFGDDTCTSQVGNISYGSWKYSDSEWSLVRTDYLFSGETKAVKLLLWTSSEYGGSGSTAASFDHLYFGLSLKEPVTNAAVPAPAGSYLSLLFEFVALIAGTWICRHRSFLFLK
jgi:hypothetical protein